MCWTTSFLWYRNLYHEARPARGEIRRLLGSMPRRRPGRPAAAPLHLLEVGIEVVLGRGTDGTDGAQVAQLGVDHARHLLGEVCLARRRAALDDVVDRLRAADDDRPRGIDGGS